VGGKIQLTGYSQWVDCRPRKDH